MDADAALVIYLMRKLGLSGVTINDETVNDLCARSLATVRRDVTTHTWTYTIKERK